MLVIYRVLVRVKRQSAAVSSRASLSRDSTYVREVEINLISGSTNDIIFFFFWVAPRAVAAL